MPFHVNTGLFEVQAARSCIEVSERMSCEQSAIFLPNPAYTLAVKMFGVT